MMRHFCVFEIVICTNHVADSISSASLPHDALESSIVCAGPVVSGSVATNIPQTTGGSFTISGLDFGAFELTATVSLEYEADHTCSSASWTSSTVVACAVRGQGYRAGLGTYITVATVAGTRSAAFSFDGERALITDCV